MTPWTIILHSQMRGGADASGEAQTPSMPWRSATLLVALALLAGRNDVGGQIFEWQGITVKQYTAQRAYEAKQKDNLIYKYWSRQEGYARCVDDEDNLLAPTPAITCEAMVAIACDQDTSAFLPNLEKLPTGRAFTGAKCSGGGIAVSKELCEVRSRSNPGGSIRSGPPWAAFWRSC